MKRGKLILFSVLFAVFLALGAIAWESRRVLYFLVMVAKEPAGWGCDEGPVTDRIASNARGDAVAEYIKACTGIGTFVDYSIILRLHGEEKSTTLAKYDDAQYGYPIFRWIDDNRLSIDLGKVRAVWGQVDRVGSVDISYVYAGAQIGWW